MDLPEIFPLDPSICLIARQTHDHPNAIVVPLTGLLIKTHRPVTDRGRPLRTPIDFHDIANGLPDGRGSARRMRLHQGQRLRGPWIAHRIQRLPEQVPGHATDQQDHGAPFNPNKEPGTRLRFRIHDRAVLWTRALTSLNAILYNWFVPFTFFMFL